MTGNDVFKLDSLNLYACDAITQGKDEWLAWLTINDQAFEFKLDTGSQVNVITTTLQRLGADVKIRKTDVLLESFGGFVVRPIGCINLDLQKGCVEINASFMVVDDDRTPLLGLRSCVELGLLRRF